MRSKSPSRGRCTGKGIVGCTCSLYADKSIPSGRVTKRRLSKGLDGVIVVSYAVVFACGFCTAATGLLAAAACGVAGAGLAAGDCWGGLLASGVIGFAWFCPPVPMPLGVAEIAEAVTGAE